MTKEQKVLIRRWFEKSSENSNSFDAFISLWISFNAFYASKKGIRSEQNQLHNIKDRYKKLFSDFVSSNGKQFEDFKTYIENKGQNPGFIQDMRVSSEQEEYKKRYLNITSLCEYLDCLYQVRCNLFHGNKALNDSQDEKLVRYAYVSLKKFLEKLYKKEGILS